MGSWDWTWAKDTYQVEGRRPGASEDEDLVEPARPADLPAAPKPQRGERGRVNEQKTYGCLNAATVADILPLGELTDHVGLIAVLAESTKYASAAIW